MKNIHQDIDSIIFDMDGTLWDAVSTYSKAWEEYFKREGTAQKVNPEMLRSLMGVEEKIVLGKILPHLEEQERIWVYREKVIPLIYQWVEAEGGQLYEGVVPGLESLSKRYKLFIVSNCPGKLIHYFMNWSDLHPWITGSMAYGQNFCSKSNNILLIKEKYGLKNPIYVGDTDSDRLHSEKVPLPFFYMDYGFGKCERYQMKFSRFDDFTEFMLLQKSR